MKKQQELEALLLLLDDTDPNIFAEVAAGIIEIGYKAYPALVAFEKETKNLLVKDRAAALAEKLRFDHFLEEIKKWAKQNSGRNWDFIYWVNEFCDNSFDRKDAKAILANYQEQFLLHLNETETPEQNTEKLQKLVFDELFFRFNYQPLDLAGLLLESFFDGKSGSALLICMLYVQLAEEAKLPVSVVAFPGNLVLVYSRKEQVENVDEILFYINPANGEIFSKNGIDLFLKKHNLENKLRYYLPCSTTEIAALYVFTLREAYSAIGNAKKTDELSTILDMLIEIIESNNNKV